MQTGDMNLLKHKRDYFMLSLKIWAMRNNGIDPPEEILEQVRKLGRLAGVSEQTLENL
jgi:hypothetical protein